VEPPLPLPDTTTRQIPQPVSDDTMDRNACAYMKMRANTHDRSLRISRGQNRYAEFHNPGSGKSPA